MASLTSGKVGYVTLTGIVEREGDQFSSQCVELGSASCGDTVEEAFHNLIDAVHVHLEGLAESGELPNFLQARGVRVVASPTKGNLSVKVPAGKVFMTFQQSVPLTK